MTGAICLIVGAVILFGLYRLGKALGMPSHDDLQ